MFYLPDISAEVLDFGPDETRHIVKSLRKSIGDEIEITDGKGSLVTAELVDIGKRNCSVKKKSVEFFENNIPDLTIAIAPTKNIDRMEWFVEKAVEIGVRRIVPLLCNNSERKVLKSDRLQKIAVSAMKQSGNFYLPEINELQTVTDFLASKPEQCYVAYCPVPSTNYLYGLIDLSSPLAVMIGPEGDFSENEIQLLKENNVLPVSLGNTRLRTETAGVYACSAVQVKSLDK